MELSASKIPRIEVVDALRGFAVIIWNILSFQSIQQNNQHG